MIGEAYIFPLNLARSQNFDQQLIKPYREANSTIPGINMGHQDWHLAIFLSRNSPKHFLRRRIWVKAQKHIFFVFGRINGIPTKLLGFTTCPYVVASAQKVKSRFWISPPSPTGCLALTALLKLQVEFIDVTLVFLCIYSK